MSIIVRQESKTKKSAPIQIPNKKRNQAVRATPREHLILTTPFGQMPGFGDKKWKLKIINWGFFICILYFVFVKQSSRGIVKSQPGWSYMDTGREFEECQSSPI